MGHTEWHQKCDSEDGMRIRAGQDIVMCGYIGLKGTVYAANNCRERLLKTLPPDFIDRAAGLVKHIEHFIHAEDVIGYGATAVHFVEEGGIFAELWRMAQAYDTGLTVDLKKIPVRQETIELCEVYDVNPYQLLSGGCAMVMTDNSLSLIRHLEQDGINASVIGSITDSNDRIILNGEGVRYVNRPEPDDIYKFIKQ